MYSKTKVIGCCPNHTIYIWDYLSGVLIMAVVQSINYSIKGFCPLIIQNKKQMIYISYDSLAQLDITNGDNKVIIKLNLNYRLTGLLKISNTQIVYVIDKTINFLNITNGKTLKIIDSDITNDDSVFLDKLSKSQIVSSYSC